LGSIQTDSRERRQVVVSECVSRRLSSTIIQTKKGRQLVHHHRQHRKCLKLTTGTSTDTFSSKTNEVVMRPLALVDSKIPTNEVLKALIVKPLEALSSTGIILNFKESSQWFVGGVYAMLGILPWLLKWNYNNIHSFFFSQTGDHIGQVDVGGLKGPTSKKGTSRFNLLPCESLMTPEHPRKLSNRNPADYLREFAPDPETQKVKSNREIKAACKKLYIRDKVSKETNLTYKPHNNKPYSHRCGTWKCSKTTTSFDCTSVTSIYCPWVFSNECLLKWPSNTKNHLSIVS